ncbi:MAG: OmpH family outer membrane protein [Alistipes sp.]|nr:OmpH family outer membrane protein [Alistipes sp.]
MKKLIKLTLTLAMVMCSTSLFAQKFGRINLQEVIFAMPEFKEMQTKIEALSKDWSEQLEAIQVEFNNKYAEFQKALPTLSETAKQVKESELQGLQTRYTELQQVAQQDVEKQQGELFRPIHEKASDAVKKVASAGDYTAVFDMSINSLAYVNEATVTDISAAVRKELGITETPAAAQQ